EKVFPIYQDEARILKAQVYDLSEIAAKQALFGIIQVLTLKTSITQAQFKEILDGAGKYYQAIKKP
ncbi:MAG: hypothetical protein Q8M94_02775, partial [Ignavibacteria bacterium]|nr:hypothetical protein [Ignavibacteria bacterium]